MPRSIFLLGPDQWVDGETPSAPAWIINEIPEAATQYLPKHLRQYFARMIEREDPSRRGIVMDPEQQGAKELDGDFFHRLEQENQIDAYFLIIPMRSKVLGTVFEGGMLERDFHYGMSPRLLLFLEEGFAKEGPKGSFQFLSKGARTRYLETLAHRAHHTGIWSQPEALLDMVLEWAFVD